MLEDQFVIANNMKVYNLPDIYDPDNDSVMTKVSLGEAFTFITYWDGSFKLKPSGNDVGEYVISVILQDENINPKRSQ
jgi:hypothetical protein